MQIGRTLPAAAPKHACESKYITLKLTEPGRLPQAVCHAGRGVCAVSSLTVFAWRRPSGSDAGGDDDNGYQWDVNAESLWAILQGLTDPR